MIAIRRRYLERLEGFSRAASAQVLHSEAVASFTSVRGSTAQDLAFLMLLPKSDAREEVTLSAYLGLEKLLLRIWLASFAES